MECKQSPFSAALKFLIDNSEEIAQSEVASSAGVSQGFISQLKKGYKEGSEETRRKIAAFFGYEYEGFLSLGKKLLSINQSEIIEGLELCDTTNGTVIKMDEKDKRIEDLKQQIKDIQRDRDTWRDLFQDMLKKGIRGPILEKDEKEKTTPFQQGGARKTG